MSISFFCFLKKDKEYLCHVQRKEKKKEKAFEISVPAPTPPLSFGGIEPYKFSFAACIAVAVVFIFFPETELERFIFFGGGRKLPEIIPEVQFVIVSSPADVEMKNFLSEALGCFSLVHGKSAG